MGEERRGEDGRGEERRGEDGEGGAFAALKREVNA